MRGSQLHRYSKTGEVREAAMLGTVVSFHFLSILLRVLLLSTSTSWVHIFRIKHQNIHAWQRLEHTHDFILGCLKNVLQSYSIPTSLHQNFTMQVTEKKAKTQGLESRLRGTLADRPDAPFVLLYFAVVAVGSVAVHWSGHSHGGVRVMVDGRNGEPRGARCARINMHKDHCIYCE